jgi:hypothetical protein
LDIELIVAGFDSRNNGRVVRIYKGQPDRQDLLGFCAIGSGGLAAEYILFYRGKLNPKIPLRLAVYYATEGKFFGEKASGVGTRTDVHILKVNTKPYTVDEQEIEEVVFGLCQRLEPRELLTKTNVLRLNKLHIPGATIIDIKTLKPKKSKPIPKPKSKATKK